MYPYPLSRIDLQVFVKDVWKEYTGWPLNDMERQYKFMVKHVQLWNITFHGTSPRWIHSLYLAAVAAFYAKYVQFFHLTSLVFTHKSKTCR